MDRMRSEDLLDDDFMPLPRRIVRWPVELVPPEGFDPHDLATWPRISGRLEWVRGRLLYMPPCGMEQALTVTDLVVVLGLWARAHPEFVVCTNEAGMKLADDVRGADGAVFRRADGLPTGHEVARVPPVLAIEVSGRDPEPLDEKAQWYLDHGVVVVWLVLTDRRVVRVVSEASSVELGVGERIPEHPALPGLAPRISDLFAQTSRPA